MDFRIGQKVVCVVRVPPRSPQGEECPRYRAVYTVRGFANGQNGPGIYLEEIVNPVVMTGEGIMERYFENWGFRPAVERKTDISIFTKMLTPDRVDA